MKKKNKPASRLAVIIAIIVVVIVLISTPLCVWGYQTVQRNQTTTKTFTENVVTLSNPGVGYTTLYCPTFYPTNYHKAKGETKNIDRDTWVKGSIVNLMINLAPFSAGKNGVKDYDLDEEFFTNLRHMFAVLRERGSTIAVRFRYDHDGDQNPEPNSFDQVLRHITAIHDSQIFQDYADIVMYVESGFVGAYGEQWGGKYTSVDDKARLLDALLNAIPAPIPVTVRTPDTYAKWAGIERKDLASAVVTKPNAERVGLYNDGYMGSNSDLGTYANREIETAWLNQRTKSYYGGEFSGNWSFAQQFDTYLPQNCLPEMYRTHLSYINGNIYGYYKDVTFDQSLAVAGVDNSAYYGQSVFQFIRDHLGYRFVLKSAQVSRRASGGKIKVAWTITNNGFANLTKQPDCAIVLKKDDQIYTVKTKWDVTQWASQGTYTIRNTIKLPADLPAGQYQVGCQMKIGGCPIQCAGTDVYDDTTQVNWFGLFFEKG